MSGARVFGIAVVGGGPAGLAAALALGRLGIDVALIAPQPAAATRDNRTAALFAGSIELLKNLGVWEICEPHSAPITAIRIIDDTGSLFRAPEVTFHARDVGLPAFGYNVPNAALVDALKAGLERTGERVTPLLGASVTAIEIGTEAAQLTLSDGSHVEARLVAAADGRSSICRQAAGIETRSWTYPQSAIVCAFEHGRPHNGVSTEFHRPHGPLTTVPLPGNRSSLVWVESPETAKLLGALDDNAFRAALEERLQGLLGTLSSITPRGQFPLSGLSAETLGRNRVALIGEAAHVIPPIGAQGLNLGMRDVATLADCVAAALSSQEEIGGPKMLAAYASARSRDVASRIYGIDMLNRSLLADILPVRLARGLGLYALGTIGPLRRLAIKEGLQPSSGLPSLMRPAGDASPTVA